MEMLKKYMCDKKALLDDIEELINDTRKDITGLRSKKHRKALDELQNELGGLINRSLMISLDEPKPMPVKAKCQHKWRDIPYWYVKWKVENGCFVYSIHEVYICIYCKKREDRDLEFGRETMDNGETPTSILTRLRRQYPNLRPAAVVEDMVNDMIMVDRDYLKIVDILEGRRAIDKNITLKIGKEETE